MRRVAGVGSQSLFVKGGPDFRILVTGLKSYQSRREMPFFGYGAEKLPTGQKSGHSILGYGAEKLPTKTRMRA